MCWIYGIFIYYIRQLFLFFFLFLMFSRSIYNWKCSFHIKSVYVQHTHTYIHPFTEHVQCIELNKWIWRHKWCYGENRTSPEWRNYHWHNDRDCAQNICPTFFDPLTEYYSTLYCEALSMCSKLPTLKSHC